MIDKSSHSESIIMLNYYLFLISLASILYISMPYNICLTRVPIRSLSTSISSSSIICGDSLDQNTYKKLFKSGELADILFTDPPYCKLNHFIYVFYFYLHMY